MNFVTWNAFLSELLPDCANTGTLTGYINSMENYLRSCNPDDRKGVAARYREIERMVDLLRDSISSLDPQQLSLLQGTYARTLLATDDTQRANMDTLDFHLNTLSEVANYFETALPEKRKGEDTRQIRNRVIRDLAQAFELHTGKPPTVWKDEGGSSQAVFLKIVNTLLQEANFPTVSRQRLSIIVGSRK